MVKLFLSVFCMVFVQFLCGYLAVLEWKMDEGKVYRKLGFSGGGGDGHKKKAGHVDWPASALWYLYYEKPFGLVDRECDFAFDDLVGNVVAVDGLAHPVVVFVVFEHIAVFPVEVFIVVERGELDEVVVVVVVVGGEGDEEIVGIVETPFDAVAVAVVFVKVALSEFAIAVEEFHFGVVASGVVFVDALFGHGAVRSEALFFDEAVVLVA